MEEIKEKSEEGSTKTITSEKITFTPLNIKGLITCCASNETDTIFFGTQTENGAGNIYEWNTKTKTPICVLKLYQTPKFILQGPQNTLNFFYRNSKTISIANLKKKELTSLDFEKYAPESIAFTGENSSKYKNSIVYINKGGELFVLKPNSETPIFLFKAEAFYFRSIAFLPPNTLAIATDHVIKFYDFTSMKCFNSITNPHVCFSLITFSNNGEKLAASLNDHSLAFFTSTTGKWGQTDTISKTEIKHPLGIPLSLCWFDNDTRLVFSTRKNRKNKGFISTINFYDIVHDTCKIAYPDEESEK